MPSERRWLSAHVYTVASPTRVEYDATLLRVVAPFVREGMAAGIIKQFFFVRYADPQLHVRLRLLPTSPNDERALRAALECAVRTVLECAVHDATHDRSCSTREPVRWIDYEPETDRYGGPAALIVCEDFFCASSEAALRIVARPESGTGVGRLGQALLAAVVLAWSVDSRRTFASKFLDRYARANAPLAAAKVGADTTATIDILEDGYAAQAAQLNVFVDDVWDRLQRRESLGDALDLYTGALERAMQRLRDLGRTGEIVHDGRRPTLWPHYGWEIAASLLHMMNNRLGLSRVEESYVGLLGARALAVGVLNAALA